VLRGLGLDAAAAKEVASRPLPPFPPTSTAAPVEAVAAAKAKAGLRAQPKRGGKG